MNEQPLFSICHTTARPDGWQKSFGAWCALASGIWGLEYILCVDRRWGFTAKMVAGFRKLAASEYPTVAFHVAWNNGRKCSVDGWNTAAAASRGSILILNADDFFPPKDWDLSLEELSCAGPDHRGYQPEYVIHVSSGVECHDDMDLMTLGIMSRSLYQRWGYALYPGYESMRSDDDFSDHARHDGVVINGRHLVFAHHHPRWTGEGEDDEVYEHQNRTRAYADGLRLLQARRATGFMETTVPKTKVIATCTPGRNFSMAWVMCWHYLQAQIVANGYGLGDYWAYSNNIYMTREMLSAAVKERLDKFDYILWIDSDNLIGWEHVKRLIEDLEAYPDVSMVAGWYYLQPDMIGDPANVPEPKASAGQWINQEVVPLSLLSLEDLDNVRTLIEVDYSGFGLVLMRADALRLAGERPFCARVSAEFSWGMTGDDISFCLSLKEHGGKILIDPRVRVEHMKEQPVGIGRLQTILPEAGQSMKGEAIPTCLEH